MELFWVSLGPSHFLDCSPNEWLHWNGLDYDAWGLLLLRLIIRSYPFYHQWCDFNRFLSALNHVWKPLYTFNLRFPELPLDLLAHLGFFVGWLKFRFEKLGGLRIGHHGLRRLPRRGLRGHFFLRGGLAGGFYFWGLVKDYFGILWEVAVVWGLGQVVPAFREFRLKLFSFKDFGFDFFGYFRFFDWTFRWLSVFIFPPRFDLLWLLRLLGYVRCEYPLLPGRLFFLFKKSKFNQILILILNFRLFLINLKIVADVIIFRFISFFFFLARYGGAGTSDAQWVQVSHYLRVYLIFVMVLLVRIWLLISREVLDGLLCIIFFCFIFFRGLF